MIWVTGDTHIPIDIHKLDSGKFPEQKKMTKKDYVIICGDFGGIWNGSKEEKFWLDWLENKPFTTLFIDGNHENFDMLKNDYSIENCQGGKVQHIMPTVYHLMRGQVFNIDNIKIFTMGGASSHDKIYRTENKTWWADELPSDEEYEEALKNLKQNNWNVDLVITHCAPDSIQNELANWYEHDKLTNFLEVVRKDLTFKKWYFGHYHTDRQIENYTAIYKVVEQLKLQ